MYPKLVPDFTALDEALQGLDELSGPSGSSRMKAEQEALAAAVPVIRGIRAVQLDNPREELAGLAKLNRSALDDLRDTRQVDKLRELVKAANGIKDELAGEQVTQAQLTTLDHKTEALAKLTGAPRKKQIDQSAVTTREQALIKQAKTAIKRLDVRLPNLQEQLPEVVRRYQQARKLIKLGGRGKKPKDQPQPPTA